jgi:hypothetical protein
MEHEAGVSSTRQTTYTQHRRPSVSDRRQFRRMQAFEDAIAYRRARVAAPCTDCVTTEPDEKCDDHARDLELINEYADEIEGLVTALDAQAAEALARPRLASSA